jgi:hypothetical protein
VALELSEATLAHIRGFSKCCRPRRRRPADDRKLGAIGHGGAWRAIRTNRGETHMAQESDADKLDDCKPSDAELLALFREFCDLTEKVEVAVADRDEEICWRLGLPFAKDGVSAAEHKFRMKGYSAQADRIRAEMPAVSDQIKALDDLALLLADTLIQSQDLSRRQAESLAITILKIIHNPECVFEIVYPPPSRGCGTGRPSVKAGARHQNGTAQESAPAGAVIGMFGVTGKQGRVRCRG